MNADKIEDDGYESRAEKVISTTRDIPGDCAPEDFRERFDRKPELMVELAVHGCCPRINWASK